MAQRKTTIYLSSTYEDLKDHRRAVIEALRTAGHDVCNMEIYGARSQRPLDACLEDVAEADLYVGLFAFRYGFVPDNNDGLNPDGCSITELELRKAQRCGKPVLVFLADDKGSWPMPFVDANDPAVGGARITALRQRLGATFTRAVFCTPADAAAAVVAAVSKELQTRPAGSGRGDSSTDGSAVPPALTWDIATQGSPFPGLLHFDAHYAPVYFGRETDVQAVIDKLSQPDKRFLIVSGDSGVGKSSLVDAGVRRQVQRGMLPGDGPWAFEYLLPTADSGGDLYAALAFALAVQIKGARQQPGPWAQRWRAEPGTLPASLRTLARGPTGTGELVLFIDQMEELFTGRADEARTQQTPAFLQALYAAAQDAANGLRVIGTLRSDFLPQCHDHPSLLACLNGGAHHALGRARAWQMRDMVTQPAAAAGLHFSPGLVERLLDDADDATGSLPLLAFALSELCERRKGTLLSDAAYEAFGGVDGAIAAQVALAESDLRAALGGEPAAVLKPLFPRLVSVSPEGVVTRQRVPRASLSAPEATAVRVLEARRLLAGESDGADAAKAAVSVAHERLFKAWPMLRDWIADSQGQLIELRRAEQAATWWSDRHHALAFQWPLEQLKALQDAMAAFPQLPHSQALRDFAQPQWPLIHRLERPEVDHRERDDIGKLLAALGDPRPGVGLRDDRLPDIVWVSVPGGTVRLADIDHDFEVPPFELARYPVTDAQFQAFIDAADGWRDDAWWHQLTRPDEPGGATWPLPNHPRESVDWFEAVAFCRWLDARMRAATPGAAWQIRLPTEWEWQLAATAGDPSNEYPWGRHWDTRFANSHEAQTRRTTAVGMYPLGAAVLAAANGRIDDLAGNVWEWCLNKHDDPHKPSSVKVDKTDASRVLRGGSWSDDPGNLRAAYRYRYAPGYRISSFGFRVCRVSPIGKTVHRRR